MFFLVFLISLICSITCGLVIKLGLSAYILGLSNVELYPALWGIRFDIAIAVMLTLPFILISYILVRFFKAKKLSLGIPFLPVILLILIQISDALYSLNSQKHITGEANQFFEQIWNLTVTAFSEYSLFLIPLLIVIALVLFFLFKFKINLPHVNYKNAEISFLVLVIFCVLGFRGGVSGTPLRPSTVYTIGDNTKVFHAMNGAYSTIYHLFKSNKLEPLYKTIEKTISKKELDNRFKESQNTDIKDLIKENNKDYNVVIFLLESWPAKYEERFSNESINPFLDEIAKEGLSSYLMLADGKRTHEGLFATLCSAKNPFGEGIARNNLNDFHYTCLPKLLGLESTIFQGTNADLVGDLAFTLGVNHSYGKGEITNLTLPLIKWGVQDYDLFNFVKKKAKDATKPFLYIINNTNTHDESLPEGVEFKYGKDNYVGIEKSIVNYSDSLLRDFYLFFKNEIERPTLFVFVGDHTRYQKESPLDEYSVYFSIVATDNSVKPKFLDFVTSQHDIAPTILGFFGKNMPYAQGYNLLESKTQEESKEENQKLYNRSFFKDGSLNFVKDKILLNASIYDLNKITCFDFSLSITKPIKTTCPSNSKDIIKEGFIEEYYKQDLLFNGRLLDYRN